MAVERQVHSWFSASLQRDMEMLVFGHGGARVLVFPTSRGRYFDWEDRGLVAAMTEHLERGWIQMVCLDSVDGESWYNKAIPPAERARRHLQYDQYLLTEVLPFSARLNGNPFVITSGASFGAYHAVNFAFRYPNQIGRVIGMSGYYDIKRWTEGYSDDNVYFNNPCDYLVHEHDSHRLEALRAMSIILAIGQEDSALENNRSLSGILWSKDIWHALRIWDGFAHDWSWWAQMLPRYIGGHD